jgi:multidrug resistance efflux pump
MATSDPFATGRASFWQEFRLRALPYIVFGLAVAGTVWLWQRKPAYTSIVAQAEAVRTNVNTLTGGVVIALKTDLLLRVNKGDIIAQVVPVDAEAQRALFAANLESLRAQMLQNVERNTVNAQQLRLDWLRRSSELASARVEVQLAESEFQRYQPLHDTRAVSDAEFELRRSNRDALRSKVETLERLVGDLQTQTNLAAPVTKETDTSPAAKAIAAAITAAQKQLEAQTETTLLRAPIDGVVTAIARRPGENALPGESIVTVSALRPTRIIGYVRQPLNLRLSVGDSVTIYSRTVGHATATAKILQIGTQLETIDPGLLPLTSFRAVEYGLPLLIELPTELALAPGEIVNVTPAAK